MQYRDHTDESLMALFCRASDETAFHLLVRRHQNRALDFAYLQLGDRTEAEDAVQDTFIRLIRKRDQYDSARPFKPWFFQVLKNVCRDIERRRWRHVRKLREFSLVSRKSCQPPATRSLLDLLQMLSAADREVLTLRLRHGFSFREIAQCLECSEEAAKKRAQRAVARLRDADIEAKARMAEHENSGPGKDAFAARGANRAGVLGGRHSLPGIACRE